MARLSGWLGVGAALLLGGAGALIIVGQSPQDVVETLHRRHLAEPFRRLSGEPASPSKVIYLNREGALLRPGTDNARKNLSSIVRNHDIDFLKIPAFDGNARRWEQFVDCVQSTFSAYDIQIVDHRPMDRDYVMAVVGGVSDALAKPADDHDHDHDEGKVTGLAPFDGDPVPRAVVLIFAKTMRNNVRDMCETAAMELAHAYGLDHAHECRDLMTYLAPCGKRSFLDEAVPCGEYEARTCADGTQTQNSHQRLADVLGLRKD